LRTVTTQQLLLSLKHVVAFLMTQVKQKQRLQHPLQSQLLSN
jgi:hypothetical protein